MWQVLAHGMGPEPGSLSHLVCLGGLLEAGMASSRRGLEVRLAEGKADLGQEERIPQASGRWTAGNVGSPQKPDIPLRSWAAVGEIGECLGHGPTG